jgi:hypothetical protein
MSSARIFFIIVPPVFFGLALAGPYFGSTIPHSGGKMQAEKPVFYRNLPGSGSGYAFYAVFIPPCAELLRDGGISAIVFPETLIAFSTLYNITVSRLYFKIPEGIGI